MNTLPKSQILRFTEKAIHLVHRAVSRYSSKFSKHRYKLPQRVVLLCLEVQKNTTSRGLLEKPIGILRTRRDFELAELPTASTLCKSFNRIGVFIYGISYWLPQRPWFRRAELIQLMYQGLSAVTLRNTTRNSLNSRFSSSKWRCSLIRNWTRSSISAWRRHENTIVRSSRCWSSAGWRISTFCSVTKASTTRRLDDLPINTKFVYWSSIVILYPSIRHETRA